MLMICAKSFEGKRRKWRAGARTMEEKQSRSHKEFMDSQVVRACLNDQAYLETHLVNAVLNAYALTIAMVSARASANLAISPPLHRNEVQWHS